MYIVCILLWILHVSLHRNFIGFIARPTHNTCALNAVLCIYMALRRSSVKTLQPCEVSHTHMSTCLNCISM